MYEDNLFAVDTTGTQEMGGYEVLPAGLYPAIMVSASRKATQKNDGFFLECVYQIIDGEMTGKKFTSRMNLWNPNSQAVDIAKRELKSLRVALGLQDTEARTDLFLSRPVVLNITVKPRKDKPSEAENNLVAIEPYTGAPAQVRPQAPVQPAPQPQYAPAPAYQHGAVAPQHPPVQATAPAFQPNVAKPAPWLTPGR